MTMHVIRPHGSDRFEVWSGERHKQAWNGSGYDYASYLGSRESYIDAKELAVKANAARMEARA